MRFGGEIHHRVNGVLVQDAAHGRVIGDVGFFEKIAIRMLFGNGGEVRWVAGIGELVHVADNASGIVPQQHADKITADEPATACHK